IEAEYAHRHSRGDLPNQRRLVLGLEVEWLADEYIHRGLGVLIAVEVQDHHPLLFDPACSLLRVREGIRGDGDARPKAQARQSAKGAPDGIGLEANYQVHVLGVPPVAMGHNGQAADDNEWHTFFVQGPDDALHAVARHTPDTPAGRAAFVRT